MEAFLEQLFESGHVVVARHVEVDETELRKSLQRYEDIRRSNFPGIAPVFDVDVAAKAAEILLLFAQATVFREIDEGEVSYRLQAIDLRPEDTAGFHYSADLTLQFLPDLHSRLARVTAADPVVELLQKFASQWPLSSVGIEGATPETLPSFLTTGSLRTAYVDRIIARDDKSRCADPAIRKLVEAAIGEQSVPAANSPEEVG